MAVKVQPRVAINVITLILFSVAMISFAFLTFVTGVLFDNSYEVTVTMEDAGGVLSRQEVTVYGRSVGTVDGAELVEGGVQLTLKVNGNFSVPQNAVVRVLRRSPVGEQAVEVTPTTTDWVAAEPGSSVNVTEVILPSTVSELLDRTQRLFTSLDADKVGIVVAEAATALDGRADQIRQLNLDAIDLGETLLAGREDIESLLETSEPLLRMLDQQAGNIEELFENAAEFAEVLAANRGNLEDLLRTAPTFLGQFEALIVNTRANIQCLSDDLIAANEMLLGPSTSFGHPAQFYTSKLSELQAAIDKHRFFFQFGIPLSFANDPVTGLGYARVKFELDKLTSGARYAEPVPTPASLPGAACETDEWGTGVNAVRQDNPQPVLSSSPGILYAPLVDPTGPGRLDPPTVESTDNGSPLPATGGGLAALALASIMGAALVARRR